MCYIQADLGTEYQYDIDKRDIRSVIFFFLHENLCSLDLAEAFVMSTTTYRIRPDYRTGRLGVSKLLVKLVVKYISTCTCIC